MMKKDEKEYVVWLKNMKEFIGNWMPLPFSFLLFGEQAWYSPS
jgi:hypothetical protein